MADIQSATAEIRRGKKIDRKQHFTVPQLAADNAPYYITTHCNFQQMAWFGEEASKKKAIRCVMRIFNTFR